MNMLRRIFLLEHHATSRLSVSVVSRAASSRWRVFAMLLACLAMLVTSVGSSCLTPDGGQPDPVCEDGSESEERSESDWDGKSPVATCDHHNGRLLHDSCSTLDVLPDEAACSLPIRLESRGPPAC